MIGQTRAPIAVVGAGSGLGIGVLLPSRTAEEHTQSKYKVYPSEGGNTVFATFSDELAEYYRFVCTQRHETNAVLEHCLTGLAIPYLYAFARKKIWQQEDKLPPIE
jgi:glucokinase